MNRHQIEFITPLFSRGAYEDVPEIRPASIRGQLHWWFRALGGQPDEEKAVFGGIHGGASASRLVVRVADLPRPPSPLQFHPTLPHKPSGQDPRSGPNAPKVAYPAGTRFTLIIGERFGGVRDIHAALVGRAVHSWLLAGSLGLRATRGGGSLHWSSAPMEGAAYRLQLGQLLGGSELRFDLLNKVFPHSEQARKVITETISHQAMADVGYPLGAVRQGHQDMAPSRKTSPLRLTVRRLADGYRILAVWDGRQAVTGNSLANLRVAVDRLARGTPLSHPTEIGRLLQESSLLHPQAP